ncbi:MAG: MmgE/PrpD family protein [Alphaproteobacteria bacterium]|nr:MmgE/PrpD family protein [Alphaproteobacteria bacterium]
MTTVEYGAASLDLGLTADLCAFLSRVDFADLPPAAVHEARRGVLDWIGCALAGSQGETITKLLAVLGALGGKPVATVLARDMKLGLLEAPIANGQMGHLLDFDDTHMDGVILHTSSPVLAALFALADARPVDGKTLIAAYVTGFEAGIRAGKAAPAHHDGGWHLTGTLGTIAAGIACARQLGLDGEQLTFAAGIAATQAAGMQQNRGTMCKSFHAGRAASNGVLAALLAEAGFDSSPEIIEGKRGFARIYSAATDTDALLAGLGEEWLIEKNGYKPYACGVVQHPLIDAMIKLAKDFGIGAEEIKSVEAKVHPGVITITGVEDPETGLKSKFSLTHSAAVAYLDGNAGIGQYTDARAVAPDVAALRRKIIPVAAEQFRRDEAEASIETVSGARHSVHIDHATGTVENPMSDDALEAKFTANAEPVLGADGARRVADLVWRLDALDDMRELTARCGTAG